VSIKTSLYTYLSGNSTISATGAVIFPQTIPPQSTSQKMLTFAMDEDSDQQILDGVSGLREALFVVDCYSPSYLDADTLATAVKSALVGYRGALGTNVAEHIRKEREFDLFESDTRLHRVSLQFLIAYT